jgi:hypothetical protein
VFDDRLRGGSEAQRSRVKRLREQRALPHEQEVPGGRIERGTVRGSQGHGCAAFEITDEDLVPIRFEVEETTPVGQEVGMPMRDRGSRLEPGDRDRRAATGTDPEQRARAIVRRKENRVAVPRSTPGAHRGGQRRHGTGLHIDRLQLRGREEAERPAVVGPERKPSTLGAGECTSAG